MDLPARQGSGPRPPLWSRLLNYFGFDAVRAEQAVARLQSRLVPSVLTRRPTIPVARIPVPRIHVAAKYVTAGVVTIALVVLVLITADSITGVVADSDPRQLPQQATRALAEPSVTADEPRGAEGSATVGARTPDQPAPVGTTPAPFRGATQQSPAPRVVPVATTAPASPATPAPSAATAPSASTAPTAPAVSPPAATTPPSEPPAPVIAAPAPAAAAPPPLSCTAVYRTVDTWSGGYLANVVVTANDAPITTWTVSWRNRRVQITDSWNATLTAGSDSITATPASYGGGLAAGASLEFGFVASGDSRSGDRTVDCTAA